VEKRGKIVLCAALVFALIMAFYFGSAKKDEKKSEVAVEKLSFRNVPGITPGEINAIEDLQKKHSYFVYGINPTTEAFIGEDGGINGYAVMFCNWLSEMFGVQFKPTYYQWGDLLRGLEAGEIDFTGELMATTEAKPGYTMSSPTINRTLKYYRIHDSVPLEEIQRVRKLRFAFLTEAVVAADVDANSPYTFDTVLVDSHPEAYRLLKSGQVDAFFGLETAEGAFDQYGDVANEIFYPLIFRSSCLSTRNDGLRAIVNVLDKAMDERVLEYLTAMQKRGHQQYLENKLNSKLTEEERVFIKNNHIIPVAGDFSNYPVSFYDTREKKWNGIYFEALGEVEKLTGFKFQVANETDTPLLDLIDNIEKGQALILPELFTISEYEGRFLWSDIPVINDNFAFISRTDFRNIDANDVFHLKVGLRKHTIYSELFKTIFPAHRNITEYDTQEQTWAALKKREIDVIFASRRRLLIFTNYYEEAGFKLNFVLNHTFNSYFAYNKDAVILKTIVDKALNVIDLNNISLQWMHKTYDYRNKMAAAQRPWLIGASILFFLVLLLVTYLFLKSRSAGKELEKQVKQRTGDLAFETSKLQAVIASIPDMLFTKDTGFRYTQCNHAFEEFMGVHEKDILGKTDKDGAWLFPEHAEMISKVERTVIQENKVQ